MLDGARCVGNSYIAEEFARNEGYMGEGKYQILWCGVNATILSSQRNPSLRRRFSYLPRPPQAIFAMLTYARIMDEITAFRP